jgi:hypothetical protein
MKTTTSAAAAAAPSLPPKSQIKWAKWRSSCWFERKRTAIRTGSELPAGAKLLGQGETSERDEDGNLRYKPCYVYQVDEWYTTSRRTLTGYAGKLRFPAPFPDERVLRRSVLFSVSYENGPLYHPRSLEEYKQIALPPALHNVGDPEAKPVHQSPGRNGSAKKKAGGRSSLGLHRDRRIAAAVDAGALADLQTTPSRQTNGKENFGRNQQNLGQAALLQDTPALKGMPKGIAGQGGLGATPTPAARASTKTGTPVTGRLAVFKNLFAN